jgi:hypothetical protein
MTNYSREQGSDHGSMESRAATAVESRAVAAVGHRAVTMVGCRVVVAGCKAAVVGYRVAVAGCRVVVVGCRPAVVWCMSSTVVVVAPCLSGRIVTEYIFFSSILCLCDAGWLTAPLCVLQVAYNMHFQARHNHKMGMDVASSITRHL